MAQKFFTDNSLSMLVNKIKSYVDNVVNIIATDKADKEHGHDDTYYTKTEMDSALSSKANKSHDHDNEYDKKGSASTVQNELNSHMSNTDLHFTTSEKTKLSGIETGAQKNDITGVKGNSESSYRTGNVNITKANIGLGNVDNTSDANKPVSTAQQAAMDSLFAQAKKYADDKDALLLNNSSTAVDSIMELATAMSENEDVVDALEQAIGTKANASDLTSHTSNKSNPHGITKEQLSLGDVENKSSATIRSEITKSNVTNALGYTPYTQTEVDSLLDGKVDKVSGKGLSTNDYTTAEKTKLSGIAEGAQANVIESIKVNGKVQSISSKSVNITVPTKAEDIGAAESIHGTHVTWSTTSPKMNGTAAVGSESKVARGDHVHPTDTSRASQTDLDALEAVVDGKASKTHSHAISDVTNLQTTLDGKSNVGHNHLYYGVCSTAANTVAKTVTIDNFSLVIGAMVIVKFTNENSASSPTLNVSSTGAKPICRYGTTVASTGTSTTGWRAGSVQIFVYDGTSWIRDFWENTTYTNADLGQGYGTCSSGSSTSSAKIAALSGYMLKTGGIVSIRFTYAVPSNATLNINNTGAKNIYFRGSAITANVIKAGDIATFVYSSQYHLISIDRWQNDIDSKQATITGAATTITGSNLTASRALISNSSGKVAASAVTSTELGYLGGVTSGIQAQIDSKSDSGHTHNYAGSSSTGGAANSANKINTDAGSATQPVYFDGGVPKATTYTLGKSVPSDAVFTDAKVTQTVRATNGEFPILLRGTSAGTSTTTTGTTFGTKMTANPSTGSITVTSLNIGEATMTYDSSVGAIVFNFS